MKNIIRIIIAAIVMSFSLMSCNHNRSILFTDDNFVRMFSEIYIDYEDYLENEIIIEGVFTKSVIDENTYFMVVRYASGVCEHHEYEPIGFEIDIDEDIESYENKWVRVTRELSVYYENESPILFISNPVIELIGDKGDPYI